MRRMAALVVFSMIVAACASQDPLATTTTEDSGPVGVFASELVVFDTCDDLLDYYISNALEIVGPYGLGGFGGPWFERLDAMENSAADDGGSPAPSRDYTDTNVQVEGVDEADIVKTDGFRIVTALDDHLRTWEVGDPGVTHVGSLQLPFWPQAMFLRGDTVVTIGRLESQKQTSPRRMARRSPGSRRSTSATSPTPPSSAPSTSTGATSNRASSMAACGSPSTPIRSDSSGSTRQAAACAPSERRPKPTARSSATRRSTTGCRIRW